MVIAFKNDSKQIFQQTCCSSSSISLSDTRESGKEQTSSPFSDPILKDKKKISKIKSIFVELQ